MIQVTYLVETNCHQGPCMNPTQNYKTESLESIEYPISHHFRFIGLTPQNMCTFYQRHSHYICCELSIKKYKIIMIKLIPKSNIDYNNEINLKLC